MAFHQQCQDWASSQAQGPSWASPSPSPTQTPSQPKASFSIWAAPSGEASTSCDVKETGRDGGFKGGAETVEVYDSRSHGTSRWITSLMDAREGYGMSLMNQTMRGDERNGMWRGVMAARGALSSHAWRVMKGA